MVLAEAYKIFIPLPQTTKMCQLQEILTENVAQITAI